MEEWLKQCERRLRLERAPLQGHLVSNILLLVGIGSGTGSTVADRLCINNLHCCLVRKATREKSSSGCSTGIRVLVLHLGVGHRRDGVHSMTNHLHRSYRENTKGEGFHSSKSTCAAAPWAYATAGSEREGLHAWVRVVMGAYRIRFSAGSALATLVAFRSCQSGQSGQST